MAGNSVLILILFFVVSFVESVENEPVSSQLYDVLYDILEKMAKIEGKIEKLEKEREMFQETALSKRRVSHIVAFNAYSTTGGEYVVNQVVLFPIVLLNNGDGYNKDTGYFTAPVSGLYFFSAHICHLKAGSMVISIVHMNVKIATTTAEYENIGAGSCGSVSAPAVLTAGEYVYIKSPYAHSKMFADSLYRWPSFTGVLVQAI